MGNKQQTRVEPSDGGQIDSSRIPGWGVDADPDNDPTYPYRERGKVEVLRSIEHKRLPAVFGTTVPPSGVSGVLRRVAFKYSESNWAHWLMLMGADRVNVVEGLLQDLGRGRIPNVPAEMGARSEYRHNKRGLVTKLAVIGGVAALAAVALSRSKSSRPQEREPVSDYDED
jgi:hypothetical protein